MVVVTIIIAILVCFLLLLLFLLEKLAIQVLLECARREPGGVVWRDELRQRAQHNGVRWRLGEDDPGDAHGLPVDEAAVEDAGVAAVAEDLEGVAHVHDDGARLVARRDPAAAVEHLEARDAVVEDEGEGADVCVGLDADGQLRLRAPRVVVDLELEEEVEVLLLLLLLFRCCLCCCLGAGDERLL